ncbi:MAG: amino acid adenylation domain-containing protein [Chloroflexi bacterium]|nr:amino acid adenylation domain-containing protein [Chloroflexota bacterium]
MIPSVFVRLEEFPLTPNGKVDRKALPAPEQTHAAQDDRYVAPRTPIEEMLASIWADVLRRERIGVYDSFFELGGHSLLATQLISRVREAFQVELPLRSLFELPTVAGLAQQIVIARQDMAGMLAPALMPVPRDGALPLSFAQQRLWFLNQLDPSSSADNMPGALRLSGPLDRAALEHSLNEIVRRHETLRTTFVTEQGLPVQVIAPAAPVEIALISLQELAEAERDAAVLEFATGEARRAFDLQRGPLLRAIVLALGADEHVLLLTLHHIIADGWSWGVLFRELSALYAAHTLGVTAALPPLPIQYADYAVWQRAWLQGEVLESQLNYWRRQLGPEGTPLEPLQVPTDHPRPPVPSSKGSSHSFMLSRPLTDALIELSRREGVTLFMTLLSSWQILLARYSGQDDIAVGTPIANRTRGETEDLIGCFINMLVLRTDLTGNLTFREVLGRVREVALGAYAHQDVPFEEVVDALQPARDLSRHPLFQVMFALQNVGMALPSFPGLTTSALSIDFGTVKLDLSLAMAETSAGLSGALEYSADLFTATTVERMAAHFELLLTQVVADAGRRVMELPLLLASERQVLLDAWNATAQPYAQERLAHELLAQQAARTPEATALICGTERLSYAALDQRANQLARHLQALGVGPETRVALVLDRSLDLVVALLAVWKAGGAYVPIDPSYPAERVAFILSDAAPVVVLTQASLRATLPETAAQIVSFDTDADAVAAQPETPPVSGVGLTNLAYLIYTSGTTGTPKAVLVEHGNLLQVLHASQSTFGYRATDVQPWLASVAFDIAAFELLNPLLVGGTVVIETQTQILDLPQLVTDLQQWTLLHAVPSLLRQIVEHARQTSTSEAYARLRRIWVGGDAVPPELLADALAVFPQAELVVLYGPTEGTIICACHVVDPTQPPTRHLIGRPLPNAQLRLYDAHGQLVPVGVAGELYLGGGSVTRGYLNRPELTAEKFVELDGGRWYRTGDRARYLADGTLEFLGRTDAQVKIRGYRIEVGEVEAVLAQHAAVREAVVLARADGGSDLRLVAYLVPETDAALITDDLRQFLLDKLPPYMVPSAFVVLEGLPLSANGKVDRKALPAPDQTARAAGATYVAPTSEAERILSEIWAAVLRLEQVGIHDNFFSLGGDSILSIQVIARANQAGLRLTPKQIFQHQTIAELAAVADTTPVVVAEQGLVTGAVPLTPIQQHFFAQSLPTPQHFNQAVLLEAGERLDPAVLEQALHQLLLHHDALRLRFHQTESGWMQEHAVPDKQPLLTTIELGTVPQAELAAAATEVQASLDLQNGPLLRAALFELGPGRAQRLLIVVHHLAVDAVSWPILLEDLESAYTQARQGTAITLPSKTTAFKQWAERLVQYADSPALLAELPFWQTVAQEPVIALPVDVPTGANLLATSATVTVRLSAEETSALLHEVPNAYQTQITEVLLTALAQALNTWTGGPALRVDLEGHGREDLFADVDLSRTVGWFTALYPVLLAVDPVSDPGAAIKAIKEQVRQVPQRGVGYGLLRYLNPSEQTEALRTMPAAEVNFNYLGQVDRGAPTNGLFRSADGSIGDTQSADSPRRYLLEITALINEGVLQLSWMYSQSIHQPATIEALAQDYIATLQMLIAHCLAPDAGGFTPSDFPEMDFDQDELDDLFEELSGTIEE